MWMVPRWPLQSFTVPAHRRRAVGVCLLLLLLWAGDRAGGWLLEQVVLRSQDRFGQLYRGGMEHEVLVLGNSRAVNSFCATEMSAQTGCSCFNLAHNGHSMEISEALLLDYLDRNAAPELLILEVSNVMAETRGAVQSLRHHSLHSLRLRALLEQYDEKNQRVAKLSWLYGFNNEMFLRSLFYLRRSDQDWINHHRISASLVQQTQADSPLDFGEPLAENLAALERIVQVCQAQHIRCRLVIAPYLPAYREKIQDWEAWKFRLKSAVPDGVELRDDSLGIADPENFADRVHLNLAGSRELLNSLLAKNWLADPRVSSQLR